MRGRREGEMQDERDEDDGEAVSAELEGKLYEERWENICQQWQTPNICLLQLPQAS